MLFIRFFFFKMGRKQAKYGLRFAIDFYIYIYIIPDSKSDIIVSRQAAASGRDLFVGVADF